MRRSLRRALAVLALVASISACSGTDPGGITLPTAPVTVPPLPVPTTLPSVEATDLPNDVVPDLSQSPECAKLADQEARICYAYIVNASLGARLSFYKFGSSSNPTVAQEAKERLQKRYDKDARRLVEGQARSFPEDVNVDAPSVRIESVKADLARDTATLRTVESWLVKDKTGKVLFEEKDQPHTVTLSRTQSFVLRRWVVTQIK